MVFAAGTMSYLKTIQTTSVFTYTNNIQTWVAPADGNVTCTIRGASGGSNMISSVTSNTTYGGKGAVLTFNFSVKENNIYYIYIGATPPPNTYNPYTNGGGPGNGGGGASAITFGTTILAVAGAGGGAGFGGDNNKYRGGDSSGTNLSNITSPVAGAVYSGNAGFSTTAGSGGGGAYTTGGAAGVGRDSSVDPTSGIPPTNGFRIGGNGGYKANFNQSILGGNGFVYRFSTEHYFMRSGGNGNISDQDGACGGGGGGWHCGGGGAVDNDAGRGTGGGAGSSFIASTCTNRVHNGAINSDTGSATLVFIST